MIPNRRNKTLAFESLEDRKLLAGNIFTDASSAIRTLTQQANIARQQVGIVSTTQQIASLSAATARDLAANSTELAGAYRSGNAADIQQQTGDQAAITNALKQIALDQANVGKTVGAVNVNISRELASSIQEVNGRLTSAIRSGSSTLVTSDIISQEQSDLNALTAAASSQLSSLLSDAQAQKLLADSLVGNSITTPTTPPSPPAPPSPVATQGNFTGSFNILFANASGITLNSPGTLNASLSIANNVLSGNVTGGKVLQYLSNSVPDGFANITGGSINGTLSGNTITGSLTVNVAATAKIAAHTEVFSFTANLIGGRVINGRFTANGIKGGNLSLVKI